VFRVATANSDVRKSLTQIGDKRWIALDNHQPARREAATEERVSNRSSTRAHLEYMRSSPGCGRRHQPRKLGGTGSESTDRQRILEQRSCEQKKTSGACS
jgi:hypothetical protein